MKVGESSRRSAAFLPLLPSPLHLLSLAPRPARRMPPSSTTSTDTTTPSIQALALLLPLFGTRFSPAFLTSCIAYWAAQPPPTPSAGGRKRGLTAEELAARVAEKLLGEEGEGGGGGRREEVVAWVGQRRAGREGAGRQKEDRGKGKGKARQGFGSGEGEEGKREDLTLARNLALYVPFLLACRATSAERLTCWC